MSIKLVKMLISIKWTKVLLVHAIKRVKRHYEIGKCSILAYPIFISLMHFSFKTLMLSQDLMLGGREFHNEVDVEAKVFPPSVALLLLGHRSVM